MAESAGELRVTAVFEAIVGLAERLGVSRINDLPGCWEHQVDEHWWVALNGHRVPVRCSKGPDADRVEVPPFTCYVEFNGWPAGLVDALGGCIASGSVANEPVLIEALNEAGRAAG